MHLNPPKTYVSKDNRKPQNSHFHYSCFLYWPDCSNLPAFSISNPFTSNFVKVKFSWEIVTVKSFLLSNCSNAWGWIQQKSQRTPEAFPGNIWVLFCKQRVAIGRGGSISNCKNVYFTYYSYEIANAIALMFMLRGNNKNRNFCKYILTSSKTIAAHEKKTSRIVCPAQAKAQLNE